MTHSKTYYVVRGICRALTQLVIAGLVLGGMYAFILLYWAAFYP
jgi:hypothetical protein